MRFSKQREAVYTVLAATDTHPDAAWVYARARKIIPNISLGTVYRNLDELCDCGRARRISAEGHAERFDANTMAHPHFVCEACGRVLDVDESLVSVSCKVAGVRMADIMLYGECEDCRNKTDGSNAAITK